ncbi:MAG: hypothetical protein EXQ70_06910 [Solirubrobacterales bacterium]|nr:hypothetical protein [Solirubrobacterales bacterium]
MDGSIFYFAGGALIVAALILAAVGLRNTESFPSRGAMAGVIVAFAVLVAATGAFAWVNASDEKEKRNEELAAEQAEAQEADAGGGEQQGDKPAAEGETLDLTSPEDGSLSFDPDTLEASSTTVTVAYDNPSMIPHNVAIEDSEGEQLGETPLASEGEESVTLTVEPGDYVYFCTVPGHREGGMEGDLTVK